MKTFKERMKRMKFCKETVEFCDEHREDLIVRQSEFISSLVALINVKFRKNTEEDRINILVECLQGLFSEEVARNTYEFLKNNGMCEDSKWLDILGYYLKKYVLKKDKPLLL